MPFAPKSFGPSTQSTQPPKSTVQPPSVTHESPVHAARTGLGAEDSDDSEFGIDVWSHGSHMPSPIPESDNEWLSNETELLPSESVEYHPTINGKPWNVDGAILPNNTPPPPFVYPPANNFSPYKNWPAFELADLIYQHNQMPTNQINDLLQI
ncbi:hypothetical protein ARMGADRAFT_1091606 [Armillaria gallica]|uniref:Uncharacterized protein n=1 Tax=Armillaria gallica TaxID=47427 RepID=A0A2H3CGS4_ARMGA|nr:hypothetical protein ARMGADRAFT_1091606 [Armillaria gallica]